MLSLQKFKLCTRGPLAFPHSTLRDADVLGDKVSARKIKLLSWRGGRVMIRRPQAESVAKQHVHLRADLVNGRLRAECGGVGATVSFHPQTAVPGSSGSSSVTQRAHQTVHIGLLKRFRFTLATEHNSAQHNSAEKRKLTLNNIDNKLKL